MRVSFTAYHRVEYFEESLLSWSRVRGIETADLKTFLEPSPFADEMTEVANRVLPHMEVHVNEERQGVLTNPWVAMDNAFALGEDFAMIGEDDITVSTDLIEYFEWARDEFREDPEVLAICAFDSHLESSGHEFGAGDVTKQRWFSPLVWGTWDDRWYGRMRETWDFDYTNGGWDWHLRLGVMGETFFCVFPRLSRSTHIGELDGTHMPPAMFKETQAGTFVEDRDPTDYRLVGYLDFWDGVLSDTPSPFDPSRSLPPSVGQFQRPVPIGPTPNNPEPKAVWQPPVP